MQHVIELGSVDLQKLFDCMNEQEKPNPKRVKLHLSSIPEHFFSQFALCKTENTFEKYYKCDWVNDAMYVTERNGIIFMKQIDHASKRAVHYNIVHCPTADMDTIWKQHFTHAMPNLVELCHVTITRKEYTNDKGTIALTVDLVQYPDMDCATIFCLSGNVAETALSMLGNGETIPARSKFVEYLYRYENETYEQLAKARLVLPEYALAQFHQELFQSYEDPEMTPEQWNRAYNRCFPYANDNAIDEYLKLLGDE